MTAMTSMLKSANHTLLTAPLLLIGAVGLVSAMQPTPASEPATNAVMEADFKMKPGDHKKVGEKMGQCIEAYLARDGRRDTEEELRSYIEKKWAKAAGKDREALALSDDLAAALWYAKDYSKTKGVRKGKIEDLSVPVTYNGEYVAKNAIWIPKKYDPKKVKYPLIFCIPDADEKPEAHLNDHWALAGMRDNALLVALDMPEGTDHWGGLGEKNNADQAGGYAILLTTFGILSEGYAIDYDKIFIAGRGAGVAAAMQIAEKSPDRFAGIIGRTGDAAEMGPTNLSNMACYFAGAGPNATAYAEAAKEAEYAESTVNPAGNTEDIWTWIGGVSRMSNPETVRVVPGKPSTKAYWIEAGRKEYADGDSLVASINRAANTITIESIGVESVTLFFNDTLVDMDKKVKVIINGAVHEDEIPRNFYSMMEQIYRGRSDSGKLYTAFKAYDVPSTESSN
ncbi:MAG: hypothetical protein ACI9F9_002042 [Candidatus Paceibacteria bacterium]|jgi:hypothetical protein